MLFGMGTVFIFLTLMVLVLILLANFVKKHPGTAATSLSSPTRTMGAIDPSHRKAIELAVSEMRSKQNR